MTIEVTLDDFLALPWRERIEVRVVRIVFMPSPLPSPRQTGEGVEAIRVVELSCHQASSFSPLKSEQRARVGKQDFFFYRIFEPQLVKADECFL